MSEFSTDRWLAIAGIVISIASLFATPFITKSLIQKIFKTVAEWSMFLILTFLLVRLSMQDEPITRLTIISLSMNVAALLVLVLHKMYLAMFSDLHQLQIVYANKLLEMQERQLSMQEDQIKIVQLHDRLAAVTEEIIDKEHQ